MRAVRTRDRDALTVNVTYQARFHGVNQMPGVESGIVTVAAIRKPRGKGVTKFQFNERQQVFGVRQTLKTAALMTRRLRQAHEKNEPVKVRLDCDRGAIKRVDALSEREIGEFHEARILLDKPDKILPVDIDAIDPMRFNIVDLGLKFRTFKMCLDVVPNYNKAKQIFDFCAAQSCHLPTTPSVTPCIPFQYVIDGCYARAHKMRWIITTKYGYCCEKVFSFATAGNDILAVKADKWGGCCVEWWYHVAPLVRVLFKVDTSLFKFSFVLAYVIDPGMFDQPVLLSNWLAAQKNTLCNSDANVTTFSIQPGAAYTPAFGSTNSFTTDPNYVSTDATLNMYKNGVTCP